MEWFGITMYGFPDPFKDLMKPGYTEPVNPEILSYNGDADGYAYGSYDRLITTRKRGIVKPVGPNDMYKYPGTDSMKFGWWKEDPCIINETWIKCAKTHPITTSEMSRYFNKALETDKYFRL